MDGPLIHTRDEMLHAIKTSHTLLHFIEPALRQRIERSIAGRLPGWTVERGEPKGSAFGGAIEVAVEEYLANLVL